MTDRGLKEMIMLCFGVLFVMMAFTHWTNTVTSDQTLLVTQITQYKNRVFIYSYENVISFARIPFGDSMDLLRIIEPGKYYRIVFTGYHVISVEEVR